MSPRSRGIFLWVVASLPLVACGSKPRGSRFPESRLRLEQPFPALADLERIAKQPALAADGG